MAGTPAPPRLHLSRDVRPNDRLFALEFGRVPYDQPPALWRAVGARFAWRLDEPEGRVVGFRALEPTELDLEDRRLAPLWEPPIFDVPLLGLSAARAGEVLLAVRAQLGDRPTLDRAIGASAIDHGPAAVRAWRNALAAGDASAHLPLGRELLDLGADADAYRHLRHYVELAPHGAEAWAWYGEAAERLGERAEAVRAYLRAASLEEETGQRTDAAQRLEDLEPGRHRRPARPAPPAPPADAGPAGPALPPGRTPPLLPAGGSSTGAAGDASDPRGGDSGTDAPEDESPGPPPAADGPTVPDDHLLLVPAPRRDRASRRVESVGDLAAVGRTRGPRGGSGPREGALAGGRVTAAGNGILFCASGLSDLDAARAAWRDVDAAAHALLDPAASGEAMGRLARELTGRVRADDARGAAVVVSVVLEDVVRWLRIGECTVSVLGRSPAAMRVRTGAGSEGALHGGAIAGPASALARTAPAAVALEGATSLKRGSWVVVAAGAPSDVELPGRPRRGRGLTADPGGLVRTVLDGDAAASAAATVTAAAHVVPVTAPLP